MPTSNEQEDAMEQAAESAWEAQEARAEQEGDRAVDFASLEEIDAGAEEDRARIDRTNRRNADAGTDM